MSTTTDDMHPIERELDLKRCKLIHIADVIGGKLLISKLPYFPPIDCCQDNCEEFADYLISILTGIEDRHDSFLCEKHKDFVLKMQEQEVPFEIVH